MMERIQPKSLQFEKMRSLILIYIFLIVLLLFAQIISPGFMSVSHIDNILRQAAFLGIASIGQTLVILTGGIDLSVASLITFSNVVAAQLMYASNENFVPITALILSIGFIAGLCNGLGILFLRIPPIIMTLALSSVVQGFTLIYCQGAAKGYAAPILKIISTGKIGGTLSIAILIWIALAAITIFMLKKTVFGRNIYMMGTNQLAAKYSGVNVTLTTLGVYSIAGVMSTLTGLLILGYTNTGFINAGNIYSMNSIAAVVIGGTSIMGGKGGYVGTIAGSIIMIVIMSLLTIIQMAESVRQIVQGSLIVILVLLYSRKRTM